MLPTRQLATACSLNSAVYSCFGMRFTSFFLSLCRSYDDYVGRRNSWGSSVTGLTLAEVLRASHIKPWAECETDEERLDVFNGLLLAPHLDALFDKGLITFSDDGRMIYSRQLEYEHRQRLGLDDRLLRNVPLSDRHLKYLAWHRSKVFRGDVQTE